MWSAVSHYWLMRRRSDRPLNFWSLWSRNWAFRGKCHLAATIYAALGRQFPWQRKETPPPPQLPACIIRWGCLVSPVCVRVPLRIILARGWPCLRQGCGFPFDVRNILHIDNNHHHRRHHHHHHPPPHHHVSCMMLMLDLNRLLVSVLFSGRVCPGYAV